MSDINATVFHIHIEPKSQYLKPLEQLNFNLELLKTAVNFYKYSWNIEGHFSFTHILDKCKTKDNYFYNRTLNRPFSGQLKISGLLCIKDEDEQLKSVSNV